MIDKIREISVEGAFLIIVSIVGWIYTAGTLQAHLDDTIKRLDRVEEKLDEVIRGQQYMQPRRR